jgi:hypothetical protein
VGSQSHPVEPGQQPEASLASWRGGPVRRSVDRQCPSRAMEPRELYPRRASVFVSPGAASAHRHGLVCRSRRGRRTGQRHKRVPQELGTPCTLHDALPVGDRTQQPQAPRFGVLDRRRANRRRTSWYRQAKHNEARRDGGRDSECSIVPLKSGNAPARTRGREGSTGSRHRWEATWPVLRNRIPCQRDNNG